MRLVQLHMSKQMPIASVLGDGLLAESEAACLRCLRSNATMHASPKKAMKKAPPIQLRRKPATHPNPINCSLRRHACKTAVGLVEKTNWTPCNVQCRTGASVATTSSHACMRSPSVSHDGCYNVIMLHYFKYYLYLRIMVIFIIRNTNTFILDYFEYKYVFMRYPGLHTPP